MQDSQMDKNAETGVKAHLLMTRGSLSNLLLMLHLPVSFPLTLSPSLPVFPTHKTTVKCSLTQKCQGMRLHLAAVVYNALWSRLIRICDTSLLFLFCLLGIWIIKEQFLKGAFSFSISSVLYFSERHISIFLLRKFIWSRQGLRGFQSGWVFQGEVILGAQA